jgi:hypothetical protein
MVVTLETTHLERSLVNTPALKNAVKIIQQQIYKRKRTKFPKEKEKIKKMLSIIFYNKFKRINAYRSIQKKWQKRKD